MTDARRAVTRSRIDRARRSEWFASWLPGIVGGIAIIGAIVALTVPLDAARQLDGRIAAFGIRETDEGSRPHARIDLISRSPVWVRLSRLSTCRIGQRVMVIETRVWFGSRYALAQTACLNVGLPDSTVPND